MTNFAAKTCVPCEGGTSPLERNKIQEYLVGVEEWEVRENKRIFKTFKFKGFREAIDFVNQVATLAEQEGHHPDIIIRYRKVTIELTTHAIQGLSENDFIMAAKIDLLYTWEEHVQKTLIAKLFSIKLLIVIIVILAVFLAWQRFF
jgi:4a-hydroxytetrahydrobiopterin dehydratase